MLLNLPIILSSISFLFYLLFSFLFFFILIYSPHTRAVLEISLSSFQAACLSRTCTVGSSCRVSSDAATQIFAKVSNFPSWRPKKRSSLYFVHFLNFECKQRPVNTAIQPAMYASWNVVAEKSAPIIEETPEWFLETSETPLKPPLSP